MQLKNSISQCLLFYHTEHILVIYIMPIFLIEFSMQNVLNEAKDKHASFAAFYISAVFCGVPLKKNYNILNHPSFSAIFKFS